MPLQKPNLNSRFHQGYFKPRHPEKYKGDPTNIVYRSRWECRAMDYFDKHPSIIKWCSEEIVIPYYHPMSKKKSYYYPDFLIQIIDKYKNKRTILIEIKPFAQTQQPVMKKSKKTFLAEQKNFSVNQAKWEAAKIWCKKNGAEFQILTEKELGL